MRLAQLILITLILTTASSALTETLMHSDTIELESNGLERTFEFSTISGYNGEDRANVKIEGHRHSFREGETKEIGGGLITVTASDFERTEDYRDHSATFEIELNVFCDDSDGDDPVIRGTTEGWFIDDDGDRLATFTDYCSSGDLIEYTCVDGHIERSVEACAGTCDGGRCVTPTPVSVYIDPEGPTSDLELSTGVIEAAREVNPGLPSEDYTGSFEDYTGDETSVLAVSNGEIVLIGERIEAIETVLDESDIKFTRSAHIDDLRWLFEEPVENEAEPEPVCGPRNETTSYCPDGSVNATCTCDGEELTCETLGCAQPSNEPAGRVDEASENDTIEEVESERGWLSRIAYYLFGWL